MTTPGAATTAPSPRAKRVSEMTPEERLASLTAWAEEQKYVQPGQDGTFAIGPWGIRSMSRSVNRSMSTPSYAGPVRYVPTRCNAPPAYETPPSYESAVAVRSTSEGSSPSLKKQGRVRKWMERRREK